MPRPRYMKASDVYRQRQPPGAKVLRFYEVFPDIEEARVEVQEVEGDTSSLLPPVTYTERVLGEFIDCSNPVCYDGGFRIGAILREMAAARETEREDTKSCQGYRASPKGRRRYGGCRNYFKIKVSITYRQAGQ